MTIAVGGTYVKKKKKKRKLVTKRSRYHAAKYYAADDDLGLASKGMTSIELYNTLCSEILPTLTLESLSDVALYCQDRIKALQAANDKHGWWRVRVGKNPEQLLNDEEKCLLLGIEHKEYNAKGQANKIMAIKRLRERTSWGLKECKELVDSYIVRVEAGDASPPVILTPILGPEEVPDFKGLEGELL
jgi:ribosomal protein L7/L12